MFTLRAQVILMIVWPRSDETRLRPIPEFTDTTDTDTDTSSDVIAATANVVSRQCVSTEQACAVHVCVVLQKIL